MITKLKARSVGGLWSEVRIDISTGIGKVKLRVNEGLNLIAEEEGIELRENSKFSSTLTLQG